MAFLLPFVPQLIGAGVAGAVALNATSQAKKSADAGLAAQTAANDKALADQQAARDQILRLEQPFVNAGTAGLSPLLQRIGVNSGTTQGVGVNDPATANIFDRRPQGGATDLGTRPTVSSARPGATLNTAGTGDVRPPMPSTAKADGGPVIDPASVGPIQPSGPVAPPAGATDSFPLSTPATGTPQGAASTAGQPDWDAYLAANPDVAAWAASGHGDPSLGPNQTPEQAAAYQFHNSGQGEGRAPPPTTAAPAPTADTSTQADPNAPPPTWQGNPTDASGAPIYTRAATGSAPDVNSFFSNFQASPGYDWRLSQGQRNQNANSASRGLGQSGAAIKGAIDYGQNQASAEYGNWFNQQQTKFGDVNNQFNTANARADANFNTDQNVGTNLFINERNNTQSRYDTNTGNLFDLAAMGQRAAGSTGQAAQTYADNTSSIFGSQANAQAAAAAQRAQANSQFGGAIGAAAGNIFARLPSYGTTSGNLGTATQPSYAGGY